MVRALVADDHEIIRRGIRQILLDQYPSAFIEEATDGRQMAEKAIGNQWDIVISDITMPLMSGLEALKQVKEQAPALPVLIISTPSEDQYTVRILNSGAAGYLSKDSISEELINAVQQIIEGQTYIHPDFSKLVLNQIAKQGGHFPPDHFCPHELEVFKLVAQGMTLEEIAKLLSKDSSFETCYNCILHKMGMGEAGKC